MGDQMYAYRSQYSTHTDHYDPNPARDDVCRTTILDGNARQRTVIGGSPAAAAVEYKSTYVIKPAAADHRRHTASPPGRRPQEVDEFLTAVQFEASHAPPYGNYRNGNSYGGAYYYSSEDEDDSDTERAPVKGGAWVSNHDTHPVKRPYGAGGGGGGGLVYSSFGSNGSRPYEVRVDNINPGQTLKPYGGVVSPVKPTSDIEEAVGSLKTGKYESGHDNHPVKPYGSGLVYSSFGSNNGSRPYDIRVDNINNPETLKPYGVNNTGVVSRPAPVKGGAWGSGMRVGELGKPTSDMEEAIGSMKSGNKYEYHSAKPYGGLVYSSYGSNGSRPNEIRVDDEDVKPYGTSNSNVVLRPYSSSTSSTTGTVVSSTYSGNGGVIDCYEAARKYGGKVIRT